MRPTSRLAIALFGAVAPVACSLLVDTGGLSGGPPDEAGADASQDAVPDAPTPTPPPGPADAGDAGDGGGRVTAGLLALYTFSGSGGVVKDVSGVAPALDLAIQLGDGGTASVVDGGLAVGAQSIVASQSPATKIIAACKASGAVTIEAWITPANTTQSAARIAGVGGANGQHDIGLDQYATAYATYMNGTSGLSRLDTASGSAATLRQHLVTTFAADATRIMYVDGVERARDSAPDAALAGWTTSYGVTCANATSLDSGWSGTFHLVAFYGRALTPAEIAQNHAAGPP